MGTNSAIVRSVAGIGLAWGLLWAVLILVTASIIGVVDPDSIDQGESGLELAGIVGPVGLAAGLVFAGVLTLLARGASPLGTGLVRATLLGALVAGLIPPVIGAQPSQIIVLGVLGAISGLVSLPVMRRILTPRPTGVVAPQ